MRVGFWAAAAAAVLCAGQASAATFVQYEARGTGFVLRQVGSGFTTTPGDFTFDFVVETDSGYGNGPTYGTGSQYVYQSGSNDTFSANVSGGVLGITGQYTTDGGYGYNYTSTINLPSFTVSSFNQIPTPTLAAGLVTYNLGTYLGGTRYSGSITNLFKIGTVTGFIEPTVSVLPEPTTWAMLIVGFGLAGAILRRRRSYQQAVSFA